MTPRLSEALLSELDRRHAQAQPWERERLSAGTPPSELEDIFAPTGVALPPEAYTWWSWRTARTDPPNPKVGHHFVYSPASAVRNYQANVELYDDIAESESDRWPAELMPFAKEVGGSELCFTCTGAESPPITLVQYDTFYERPFPTAPSLGTVVTWWIECFDTGIYTSEPEKELLLFDFHRVPPERNGFV